MIEGTRIHLISPNPQSGETDRSCLTAAERSRAATFRFPEHASRWISYRASLRRILGDCLGIPAAEVPIHLTEHGKPVLQAPFDALHFNLSHCDHLGLLALGNAGSLGIDLEPQARATDLLECEATFCHPLEIQSLPVAPASRGQRLLEIWTAKEALLKAIGTGFMQPPEEIHLQEMSGELRVSSDSPLFGVASQFLRHLPHPLLAGYQVSLCSPAGSREITVISS